LLLCRQKNTAEAAEVRLQVDKTIISCSKGFTNPFNGQFDSILIKAIPY